MSPRAAGRTTVAEGPVDSSCPVPSLALEPPSPQAWVLPALGLAHCPRTPAEACVAACSWARSVACSLAWGSEAWVRNHGSLLPLLGILSLFLYLNLDFLIFKMGL